MENPIELVRICKVCKEEKPIEKFQQSRSNSGARRLYKMRICYVCRQKKYKERHPEVKPKQIANLKIWVEAHSGTISGFIYRSLWRWRKKNKEYLVQEPGLTYDFLLKLWEEQKGCCYYSGVPLNKFKKGWKSPSPQILLHSPSLDRVDSSKGYVQGNVVWCSNFINCLKADLSKEDFIALCKGVIKLHS